MLIHNLFQYAIAMIYEISARLKFNSLATELTFRHAVVDRLPAHSCGAHRDLKFYSFPNF